MHSSSSLEADDDTSDHTSGDEDGKAPVPRSRDYSKPTAVTPPPAAAQKPHNRNVQALSISSEEMRKSFREKLEAFKAMERQFSQAAMTAPPKARRHETPLNSFRSLPRANSTESTDKLDEYRNRGRKDPPAIVYRTATKRSATVDPRPKRRYGTASSASSQDGPPRIPHIRSRRRHSNLSFNTSADEEGSPLQSSALPTRRGSTLGLAPSDSEEASCAACEALRSAEQYRAARDQALSAMAQVNRKVIAMIRCLESAKALEEFHREKHPAVADLAEEARALRRLREKTPSTPRVVGSGRSPSQAYLLAGSPSTTASSSGSGLTGPAAMFSRKTIGSALSAISTPIRDKLRRQTERTASSVMGLSPNEALRTPASRQTDGVASFAGSGSTVRGLEEADQMFLLQKRKLIQHAFRHPESPAVTPVRAPAAPIESPSAATQEKAWKPGSNSGLGTYSDCQAASPAVAPVEPAGRPWSTLMEATTRGSPFVSEDLSASPHPLAHLLCTSTPRVSSPNTAPRTDPDAAAALLEIIVDQHELISQLNGFNDAVLTELRAVQALVGEEKNMYPESSSTASSERESSRVNRAGSSTSCLRHSSPATPKQQCLPSCFLSRKLYARYVRHTLMPLTWLLSASSQSAAPGRLTDSEEALS